MAGLNVTFWNLRNLLACVLLVLLILAAYWNIFPNTYIWDDHWQIEHNALARSWNTLYLFFIKDNWLLLRPEGDPAGYWRPLFYISYYLDFSLPIKAPLVHHLVDLLLYLVCSYAVWCLLRRLTGERRAALLAAIFFVLWPLHTEAVTFMGSRHYSIAAIFFCAAAIAFYQYWQQGNTHGIWLAGTLFTISLLFTEFAIIFPVLLVPLTILHWQASPATVRRKKVTVAVTVFVCIAVIYLGLRRLIAPPTLWPTQNELTALLLRSGSTMLRTLRGLFWPFNFTVTTSPTPLITAVADAILGYVGYLALLLLTAYATIKKRVFAVGLWWIVVPTLLFVFPWPRDATYQDRYLFFPSIGVAICLALALTALLQRLTPFRKKALLLLLAIIFVSFTLATLARNLDYRNDISFWCTEAKLQQQAFDANRSCGGALLKTGQYALALPYYDRALKAKIDPVLIEEYAYALGQLGECRRSLKYFDFLRRNFTDYELTLERLTGCEKAQSR